MISVPPSMRHGRDKYRQGRHHLCAALAAQIAGHQPGQYHDNSLRKGWQHAQPAQRFAEQHHPEARRKRE